MFFKRKPSIVDPSARTTGKKIRYIFLTLCLLLIFTIGWVVGSGLLALKKITADSKGNTGATFFKYKAGEIPASELAREGDGRINIMIIGLGGANHPGGYLTDTIQVLSIDPINNKSAMVSVPRDFYVEAKTGYYSKINAVYSMDNNCLTTTCSDGDPGAKRLKTVVGNILDLTIDYYVRLDFQGFKEIVDSIGGIQVNVEKDLIDPYYPADDMKGYAPLTIKAGLQTFDGTMALKYARSRETTSDFDRARRQQQVISAIVKKSMSVGVLTNPKKVTDIFSAAGNHIRTDVALSQFNNFIEVAKSSNITSADTLVLDTAATGPLTSVSDPSAGYIIMPKLGKGKYADVQQFVHKVLPEPYITRENARIIIHYSASNTKQATALKTLLTNYGYNVVDSTLISKLPVSKTTVVELKNEPYAEALLKKRLSAEISTTKSLASGVTTATADLVIVVGATSAK